LQQPAGLGRRPTYFHLLAQMKVGKAKGLELPFGQTSLSKGLLVIFGDCSNESFDL